MTYLSFEIKKSLWNSFDFASFGMNGIPVRYNLTISSKSLSNSKGQLLLKLADLNIITTCIKVLENVWLPFGDFYILAIHDLLLEKTHKIRKLPSVDEELLPTIENSQSFKRIETRKLDDCLSDGL